MLGAINCFAQVAARSTENWQTLVPPKEECAVDVPVALLPFGNLKKLSASREYRNSLNGTYFFIFSEKRGKDVTIDDCLKFIRDHQKTGENATFGDLRAERFEFEDEEKFYHRAIFVNTSSRTYLFHAVSDYRDDNTAKRFLKSLKITERPVADLGKEYEETPPPSQKIPVITVPAGSAKGVGDGSGTGSGTGSGSGSGSGWADTTTPTGNGAGTPQSTSLPGETRNVKILSKPRAAYTDAARTYNISGSVMLRLVFQADGKMGTISPLTRLPFGLTNTAIAAAKAIRFEPALRNGVPYAKSMRIQYNFTIY